MSQVEKENKQVNKKIPNNSKKRCRLDFVLISYIWHGSPNFKIGYV